MDLVNLVNLFNLVNMVILVILVIMVILAILAILVILVDMVQSDSHEVSAVSEENDITLAEALQQVAFSKSWSLEEPKMRPVFEKYKHSMFV